MPTQTRTLHCSFPVGRGTLYEFNGNPWSHLVPLVLTGILEADWYPKSWLNDLYLSSWWISWGLAGILGVDWHPKVSLTTDGYAWSQRAFRVPADILGVCPQEINVLLSTPSSCTVLKSHSLDDEYSYCSGYLFVYCNSTVPRPAVSLAAIFSLP